jgi:hypothetical protein
MPITMADFRRIERLGRWGPAPGSGIDRVMVEIGGLRKSQVFRKSRLEFYIVPFLGDFNCRETIGYRIHAST